MLKFIYILGIITSVQSILMWPLIIRSQIRQFNSETVLNSLKFALLAVAVTGFFYNIDSLYYFWFRFFTPANPGPVTLIRLSGDNVFREVVLMAFWLIYDYDILKKYKEKS